MRLDHLAKQLGEAYYEDEGFILFHGDSVDLLAKLPHKSIDLTITSPPYNIGKAYEDRKTVEEYLNWCAIWMEQIHTATTGTGGFWLNLGYFEVPDQGRAVPISYLLWDRSPFYLLQEVVWNYGAGVSSRKTLSPRNEKFLWYVHDRHQYTFNLDEIRDPDVKYPFQKKNGKLKCNPLGKNPSDVWTIPKVTSGANRASKERTPHPAQFPIAVIDRIVKACSNVGEIVLDPFIGSGTTAIAAMNLGRKVIGIEKNEVYCELAIARYLDALRKKESQQLSIF